MEIASEQLALDVASLSAYLEGIELGIDVGLAVLSGCDDPFAIRRRLALLLDDKRHIDAASLVRNRKLHSEWADKAAAAFASQGDMSAVNNVVNWAKSRKKEPSLPLRCAVLAAQAWYARAFEAWSVPATLITPGRLEETEETSIRAALALIAPFTLPVKTVGNVMSSLEAAALQIEVTALAWIGDHEGLGTTARVLATFQPIPLVLAQLACQDLIEPAADWPARLRAEHGGDFLSQLLAAAVESEQSGNAEAAFDAAMLLVRPDLSRTQGIRLYETLQEIGSKLDADVSDQIRELEPILVPGEERRLLLAEATRRLDRGETAAAEALLLQTKDTDDTHWLQLQAYLLLQKDDRESALELLLRASAILPHPNLHRQVAVVATGLERYTEATVALKLLLSHSPGDAKVRLRLALLASFQEDYALASEHFKVLWFSSPDDMQIGMNYAASLALLGDVESAAKVYKTLASSDGAPLKIYMLLASSLKALGHPVEAFAALKTAPNVYVDHPDYLRAILDLGYAAGEEDAANQAILRLKELQAAGAIDSEVIHEQTVDEMVQTLQERREWEDNLLSALVTGQLPWLMVDRRRHIASYAAWYDRTRPLNWLAEEKTIRARYCVYATNSFSVLGRATSESKLTPLSCSPPNKPVVADWSALLTLDQLGLLEAAASYFGQIFIPAAYFARAAEESGQLVLHQRSQKTNRDQVRAAMDQGLIFEYGFDAALEAIRVSEYGENGDSSDAGSSSDHADSSYGIRDLLNVLRHSGRLTAAQMAGTEAFLHRPSSSAASTPPLRLGAPILVTAPTLLTIAQMNLLKPVTSGFVVYASSADFRDIRSALLWIDRHEQVGHRHRQLWSTIRQDNRYIPKPSSKPFPHGGSPDTSPDASDDADEWDHPANRKWEIDIAAPELACALGVPLLADDRLCQMLAFNDLASPQVSFGTDCLIESLASAGAISSDQAVDAYLQLIRWRYRFVIPPASVLVTMARRFSSPPGGELEEVALYVHDCMRDEGLLILPATSYTSPQNNHANRLFLEWVMIVAAFLADIWTDEASFPDVLAESLTEWALINLLPSPPRNFGQGGVYPPTRINSLVLGHVLLQLTGNCKLERANRAIRSVSAGLNISDENYPDFVAEVIHGIAIA